VVRLRVRRRRQPVSRLQAQRRPDEEVRRRGALLAKEETCIALETLFRRMRNIELDEDKEIEWYRNAAIRSPAVVPLVFDAPRTGAPG